MDAKALAEKALNKVRDMMAESKFGDIETLSAFASTFEAEIVAWDMLIEELADED